MTVDLDPWIAGILAGDRQVLARAITLVESSRDEDQNRGQQLLHALAPDTPPESSGVRIGITGVPGVGKSTFIDAFGSALTARKHRVAVLAVDPSSSLSGGSILGDKTRMERLSRDPNAFIRPSPGGDAVGGVAHRTREAMLLCEAAGFDVVIIETMGVGQSEVTVADMVDTFVLLLLAGAGDELQGIKRGIMELADVLVIHKADGDNLRPAQIAAREYTNALQLLPHRNAAWAPEVLTCSSIDGVGIEEVFERIQAHRTALGPDGIASNRKDQALLWFDATLRHMLIRSFLKREVIAAALPDLRLRVHDGVIQPTAAVLELLAT